MKCIKIKYKMFSGRYNLSFIYTGLKVFVLVLKITSGLY